MVGMTVRKEIILPIKCSTVKRLHADLNQIVDAELIALATVFVLWSVTLWWRAVAAPRSFDGPLIALWSTVLGGVAIIKIHPLIPTITCIKDEEEPK